VDKANLIREAIEAAGVSCWIAPRDLEAGNQWGGSIVQAIQACEAVVVVFSEAANRSPQVAREMELSVANRKPLVPIRVANDMPTDDMQYFLGVSHWFNAYPHPLETYLPDIIAAVKRVLSAERRPWTELQRRMPKSRGGQVALSIAAAAIVAVIIGMMMQPHLPTGMPTSPLAGRWQTKIPNNQGGTAACVMDVSKQGAATFSDTCPDMLSGESGTLITTKDGTWAQAQFQPGDSGSFYLEGGTAHGYAGAFKLSFFGGLTTRDPRFGTLRWGHVSGSKPLNGDAPVIIPAGAAWPLSGVPAAAQNATNYIRGKWQPDAVLMSIDLKFDASSGISASFTFYSPAQQQVMTLMPGSQAGAMPPPSAAQDDIGQQIPSAFLDLPAAIERAQQDGMQGRQINEAQLEWTGGASCGTGNFAIDNAILPKCGPHHVVGIQWQIDSALGERRWVPAN
jgi:hypothetical protein